MGYLQFLNSLDRQRDADGHSGCYRSDAIRALAQDDISRMLNKLAVKWEGDADMPVKNRIEQLNQMLLSGSKPDFSGTDAYCNPRSFDVKYASSVERCNLFLIQKQLMSLNTQAARVDVAAKLAGIDRRNIDFSGPPESHAALSKEIDAFRKLSANIVGLLTFELSRQERSEVLQKSLQLLGTPARDILAALSSAKTDEISASENAGHVSTGIRHGN